jgi:hypothetical protein
MLILLKILLFFFALAAFCGAVKSTLVNAAFIKSAIDRSEKRRQIGLVIWGALVSTIPLAAMILIIIWIF